MVGLQTDPSGLDMGHKFAKSQVLVVVGIPGRKSVPIRNLSTSPLPGFHYYLCRKFACENNYGYNYFPTTILSPNLSIHFSRSTIYGR